MFVFSLSFYSSHIYIHFAVSSVTGTQYLRLCSQPSLPAGILTFDDSPDVLTQLVSAIGWR